VLHQDVSWFDVSNPSELPTKIAEKTHLVEEGLSAKLGEGIMFSTQALGGIIYAFVKQWDVALVALAVSPPVGFGIYYLTKVTGDSDEKTTKAYAKAGGVAGETIGNMRTVAALQCEDAKIQEYDHHLIEARQAGEDRAKRIGFANGLIFSTGNFMTGVSLLYVAYQNAADLRDGTFDYTKGANAFVAMFLVQQGVQGLGSIGPMVKAMSSAQHAAYEILATIRRVPPIDTRTAGHIPTGVKGEITFDSIAFAYPSRPDPPIFKNLNVTIEAGTTVAFVGSSGSGKSTAIQLIERFYDPLKGSVMLDGSNIVGMDLNWLRSQIALVGQEPVLFNGTIRQNIRRGKPGATDDQIEDAAKAANAHGIKP
jgi:ABC-type multidrug transport system fused ATPase/permease subunit